jgi:hypothetical protein
MSIFGSILSKIFQGGATTEPAVKSDAPAADAAPASAPVPAAAGAPAEPVDVEAVLSGMAAQKGGGGNWQTSIVDLLKLLDLDSSLAARKALGEELDVHAAADGTPEQNIALHQAVMQKLAENGGKVPDSLKG